MQSALALFYLLAPVYELLLYIKKKGSYGNIIFNNDINDSATGQATFVSILQYFPYLTLFCALRCLGEGNVKYLVKDLPFFAGLPSTLDQPHCPCPSGISPLS